MGEGSGIETLERPPYAVALLPGQIRYQLRLVLRNPLGAFITLVMPPMLLVVLYSVTPEMTLASLGGLPIARFLTPAMASFALFNAGFVETVVVTTTSRERGVLKRLGATPLPRWVYLVGLLGSALVIAVVSVALVLGIGAVFLHASLPASRIAGFTATCALGLVCSFTLGAAVGSCVSSEDAALPIAYAIFLPLAFISEVFFPAPTETPWLQDVAKLFPLQPVVHPLESAFSYSPHGMTALQVLVLLLWTLAGVSVVALRFRWEARREQRRSVRRNAPRAFFSSRGQGKATR